MSTLSTIYEKIEVWKRNEDGSVVRFQCVKRLSDGMFAVQNADFFRFPLSVSSVQSSDERFIELFLEEAPADRCQFWCGLLAEAISAHEHYFSGIG